MVARPRSASLKGTPSDDAKFVHISEETGVSSLDFESGGERVEEYMKAKQPLAESEGNSASEGSTMKVRPSEEGPLMTPTATAQTTPRIGTEPALSKAAVVALINVAIRLAFHPRPTLPVPAPVSLPHKACPTI